MKKIKVSTDSHPLDKRMIDMIYGEVGLVIDGSLGDSSDPTMYVLRHYSGWVDLEDPAMTWDAMTCRTTRSRGYTKVRILQPGTTLTLEIL